MNYVSQKYLVNESYYTKCKYVYLVFQKKQFEFSKYLEETGLYLMNTQVNHLDSVQLCCVLIYLINCLFFPIRITTILLQ